MRRLLIACWLLGVAFNCASVLLLPDRVAMHFGMDGTPNGWGHVTAHVAFMLALQTLMLLLAVGIPWIVRKTPRQFVNLPNRDYWLADERLDETVDRLRRYCDELGILLQTFFIALGICVTSANLSDPVRLNNHVFLAVLAVFLVSILGWVVRLCRAFRVEDASSADSHE